MLEVLVFLALRYATTCRQTTIKQVIPDSGNTIIEVSYHGPLVCGKAILQISAASVLWSCSRRTLSENSTKTEHIPQHYKVTDTHQILTRHCFGCRSVSCPSAIIQPSIVGDGNVLEDSSRSNISELKVPTRSRTPLNHHDINRMRRYPKPLPNPNPGTLRRGFSHERGGSLWLQTAPTSNSYSGTLGMLCRRFVAYMLGL